MSALGTIMDAMADQIREAVDDVTDVDVQVEPRMVINPTPPCIDIYPADPSRNINTQGFDELGGSYVFNVRVRIAVADNVSQQDLLLAFMDDEDDLSIVGAIVDDPTLGGHASGIGVDDPTGFTLFQDSSGAYSHLGCLWRIQVIPARS